MQGIGCKVFEYCLDQKQKTHSVLGIPEKSGR